MPSFFICTQLTEYLSTRCWKEVDNWYKIFLGLPCSSSCNCKIRESTTLCHNHKWVASDNIWRKGTIWMSKALHIFVNFSHLMWGSGLLIGQGWPVSFRKIRSGSPFWWSSVSLQSLFCIFCLRRINVETTVVWCNMSF